VKDATKALAPHNTTPHRQNNLLLNKKNKNLSRTNDAQPAIYVLPWTQLPRNNAVELVTSATTHINSIVIVSHAVLFTRIIIVIITINNFRL